LRAGVLNFAEIIWYLEFVSDFELRIFHHMRRTVFVLIVCLLLGAGLFRIAQLLRGPRSAAVEGANPSIPAVMPKFSGKDLPGLSSIDGEYTRLVEAVMPSVVSVTSRRVIEQGTRAVDPFDVLFGSRKKQAQPRVETSLGSGVIVSRDGHVITNHHVIEDNTEVEVQLADGRTLPAQVVGDDKQVDIAVLKVDGAKLEPLALANSDNVRVGQLVFAIGNPFGLAETVTAGIISAKGRRDITDSKVEMLQTDAAVNHGNSGGPLINLRGEIIGINTAIYSKSEDGGWLGISFAIPANVARRALESVIKRGRIARPYLGLSGQKLTPDLVAALHLDGPNGALVTNVVPGSPAERAGLREKDVLRTFNGKPVTDIPSLQAALSTLDIGERVELGIIRSGKAQTITAEIAEMPADMSPLPTRPPR
jgi:Do/DeqQ family serine protease